MPGLGAARLCHSCFCLTPVCLLPGGRPPRAICSPDLEASSVQRCHEEPAQTRGLGFGAGTLLPNANEITIKACHLR